MTRTMTGLRLRKPKAITRKMLERWDVCFEAVTWFDRVVGDRDGFPLTDTFVDKAFSTNTIEVRFKTVWFSWLAIRVFSDLSKQTRDSQMANRVLNAKLKEFLAAVTATSLRQYPQGILMIEQARLGHLFIETVADV